MSKSIIVFTSDKTLYGLLSQEFDRTGEAKLSLAPSYSECFSLAMATHAKALIIQASSPAYQAENLMCDMQRVGYNPAILMFDFKTQDMIRYAVSSPDATPYATTLASSFCLALRGRFRCVSVRFRFTTLTPDDQEYSWRAAKNEVLNELLRGCMPSEYRQYITTYSLDLKENGYYLFLWELEAVGYREHRIYKDIYNFIGELVFCEFRDVLKRFNGGEIICIDPRQTAILINDFQLNSISEKRGQLSKLAAQLSAVGGSKYASRYLTPRIAELSSLHLFMEEYTHKKAYAFFSKEQHMMLAEQFNTPNNLDMLRFESILQSISNYILYDIRNPRLNEQIEALYLDVMKSTKSFAMYYYATSSIMADIVSISNDFGQDLFVQSLSPSVIQFSSVEEQYAQILHSIRELQQSSHVAGRTKRRVLLQAIDYIAENYSQDISVSGIADKLFISRVYLSQLFRKELNVSVIEYIINFRIEKAKKLLLDTDNTVYSVAEQVGFRDEHYFSKIFKKVVGESPTTFRKNNRNKNIDFEP